jgi:hypothetical protein
VPPDGTRASDADRDRLAAALGRHYVEGRIDADELSRRLDVLYAAEWLEQATATVGDLPPLPAPAPERRRWGRRHGEAAKAGAGWVPTTERFVDPTTQRVMRVWVDPADGSRHYVAELTSS